ncbi:PAS and ANTAR domain-containing protein [Nocardia wallacei]|uniref:PAS and ANTAR domain-containing protein n=1 Tax=Nocardia wallacei TaxID=480035 RepID=UPI003CC7D76C
MDFPGRCGNTCPVTEQTGEVVDASDDDNPDTYLSPTRTVGSFRFWFADQRWEWSDEIFAMHGYTPGEIVPTTALLLGHKHPEDRAHVEEILEAAVRSGGSFSSRHRFIDTAGREHQAMVIADRIIDNTGTVIGTAGYYLDLTDTFAAQRQEVLDETLPGLYESRALIEQAKGVLMRVYSISAHQAFDVLRWRSQETNVKLRDLSAQLLADLETAQPPPPSVRSDFDHILLTAHIRVSQEYNDPDTETA